MFAVHLDGFIESAFVLEPLSENFNDDAITIFDTKVRTKLVVSDGNVLGSGSEVLLLDIRAHLHPATPLCIQITKAGASPKVLSY